MNRLKLFLNGALLKQLVLLIFFYSDYDYPLVYRDRKITRNRFE